MPASDGGMVVHFLVKAGISACGLYFAKFPDKNGHIWLCTSPGHREMGTLHRDGVNCPECKPAVVDAALKKYNFNECEDCGADIGEDSNLVRVISGDGVTRCNVCDAARLHPALKR